MINQINQQIRLNTGKSCKNLINRKDTFNQILNCKLGDIEFRKNQCKIFNQKEENWIIAFKQGIIRKNQYI